MRRNTRLPFFDELVQTTIDDCELTRDRFDSQTAGYVALLEGISGLYPNDVSVFDPNEIYFDERGTARHVTRGVMMYSFTDHPSDAASEMIGTELNRVLLGN
jgi:hypothetical protein